MALLWPELGRPGDAGTFATLHLMTQIVGKLRVAVAPWANHSWHVTSRIDSRGLTTGLVPYRERPFELRFDFHRAALVVATADGQERSIALDAGSIAAFHVALLKTLAELGLPIDLHGAPNELPEAVPFAQDRAARPFDPDAARRLWQALVAASIVLERFRTGFLGKASPVHFFWGSFDLAVTRFSGRAAHPHPAGFPNMPDGIVREAYSHEVSSAGLWPGNTETEAVFYSYAYPESTGFGAQTIAPAAARYYSGLGEFVLPYAAVRASRDPEGDLMAFLEASYAAAAITGDWDRPALECAIGRPRTPRSV